MTNLKSKEQLYFKLVKIKQK